MLTTLDVFSQNREIGLFSAGINEKSCPGMNTNNEMVDSTNHGRTDFILISFTVTGIRKSRQMLYVKDNPKYGLQYIYIVLFSSKND